MSKRQDNIKRLKAMKWEKKTTTKEKKADSRYDVNKDGKVDEKDVEKVAEEAQKTKKKIVKKDD